MYIKNDLTDGKSVSFTDYAKILDNTDTIKLGKGECSKNMEGVVSNMMHSVVDLGIGKKEDIPDDFGELLGRLGNMNRILNDVVVIILRPEVEKRDRVGDLLAKYRDENNKKIFTEYERFNGRNYGDVRSFLRGVMNVHKHINSQVEKTKNNRNKIVTGGSVLNARRHQFVIDYGEIDDYMNDMFNNNMFGGGECTCQQGKRMEKVKLPTTGAVNDMERRLLHKMLNFMKIFYKPIEKKPKCTCGVNQTEHTEEEKNEVKEENTGEKKEDSGVDKSGQEGGSEKNDDTEIDDEKKDKPVPSLSDFLNQGDKLDDLMYSERDKSDEDKTHFNWLHWRFYRLWTMQKLHPILTLPLNIVEPVLSSFGLVIKRFVSPILLKISTPVLSAAWQGIGALISVSSMIPVVGIVTGVLSAVHDVATVPVNILLREGASILQTIIDSAVDAVSVIFNLQRGKWGLALGSLLKVIKSNGVFNTLMGQLRNFTIVLKKINKILDEIKDYPNLADEILEEIDKIPAVKEFFNSLDENKVEELEAQLNHFLKMGTSVSKYFLDKTNSLVFLLKLPESLMDKENFYKTDKNKTGGGITQEQREDLVRKFFKVAITPIDGNNRVLIREKLQLLDDLHEQINA